MGDGLRTADLGGLYPIQNGGTVKGSTNEVVRGSLAETGIG